MSIKQKEEDDEPERRVTRLSSKKRTLRNQSTSTTAKKLKIRPPICTANNTRSTTKPSETRPHASHSGSIITQPPHHSLQSNLHPTPPFPPYLGLLGPYMAFQLSLSNLHGPAYTTAQTHMASVLNTLQQLKADSEARCAHDTFTHEPHLTTGISTATQKSSVQTPLQKEHRASDVLPRKMRELNEQTRRRLETEARKDGMRGNGRRRGSIRGNRREKVTSFFSRSATSSPASETSTTASDDEDASHMQYSKHASLLSSTSSFHDSEFSDAYSAYTSSSSEDSDAIERRARNACRRRKVWQAQKEKEEEEEKEKEKQTKRPNAPGSQRVEEKEKVHTPDIVKKEEELDLQQGKEVLVVFRPVIW
ncbi:hypothetical protein ACJQWK_02745 [Exserohilum turcicum]